MKIKRIVSFVSTLLVGLSSLMVITVPRAFATTVTWTGGAGDHKFSTGGNWSGGVAPGAGDILSFDSWVGPPTGNSSNNIDLVNDLSGTVFGGVVGTGSGTQGNYYTIDTLKLADGASVQGSQYIEFDITNLQSTGTVTLDSDAGTMNANVGGLNISGNAFAYSVTAQNMTLESGSSLVGDITTSGFSFANVAAFSIQKGASLFLCGSEGIATISSNITLGGGSGANPQILLQPCKGGPGSSPDSAGAIFTGTVTLLSDASFSANNNRLVVKGGLVANGHDLTISAGADSKIMGNGTTGSIQMAAGSQIAPGNSPGCLSTGNLTMVSGSTYDFEVAGTTACTEYDQIKVTGTVNLGSGTLNTILYNGFKPTPGQSYMIIDNDGTDPVQGTFANLADGATFTVSGYNFKVSYTGGDGNDVVLTALTTPATPNTGFSLTGSNTRLTLFVTLMSTGFLMIMSRKFAHARKR